MSIGFLIICKFTLSRYIFHSKRRVLSAMTVCVSFCYIICVTPPSSVYWFCKLSYFTKVCRILFILIEIVAAERIAWNQIGIKRATLDQYKKKEGVYIFIRHVTINYLWLILSQNWHRDTVCIAIVYDVRCFFSKFSKKNLW